MLRRVVHCRTALAGSCRCRVVGIRIPKYIHQQSLRTPSKDEIPSSRKWDDVFSFLVLTSMTLSLVFQYSTGAAAVAAAAAAAVPAGSSRDPSRPYGYELYPRLGSAPHHVGVLKSYVRCTVDYTIVLRSYTVQYLPILSSGSVLSCTVRIRPG